MNLRKTDTRRKRFRATVYGAVLATVMCLASHSVTHAADDLDALLDLDIRSLAQVTVETASKRSEKITDAPGIVSVVTREDIRRFGGVHLGDVFHRLPSTYVYGGFIDNNVVSIRGQCRDRVHSTCVLFLVNGRPFRDSFTGGFTRPLIENMPLDLIEQIEIIRGPGSVLYGSNAFAGVINIITRAPDADHTAAVETLYGSNNTGRVAATYNRNFIEQDVSLVAHVFDANRSGYNFADRDNLVNTNPHAYGSDATGGFFDAQWQDRLRITSFATKGEFQRNPTITLPERIETSRVFTDIGYVNPVDLRMDWVDNGELKLNVTYNLIDSSTFQQGNGETEQDNSTDIITEASFSANLFDRVGFLFGGTYERQDIEMNLEADHFVVEQFSAYTQVDYKPFDNLKLIAGAQLNRPEETDTKISPRLGAIYNVTDKLGVKALYGEAFRSAYGVEKFFTVPGLFVSTPDVEPETIKTTDLQLFYYEDNYSLSATVFRSDIDNAYAFGLFQGGPLITYVNSPDTIRFEGIELEAEALWGDWQVQFSMMSQQSENRRTGQTDLGLVPNFQTKLGTYYGGFEGIRLGAFVGYFGDSADVPGSPDINKEADAYTQISLNAEFDLNTLLDLPTGFANTTFTVYADNLLNEEIRYPDSVSPSRNTVPLQGGREVFAALKIKF